MMDAPTEHVVKLEPELTIYGAAALRQTLAYALAAAAPDPAGQPRLALDLGDVCDIDSAGLQLLMAARRHADGHGIALELRAHSPAVCEVFALCGLDEQARGAGHAA